MKQKGNTKRLAVFVLLLACTGITTWATDSSGDPSQAVQLQSVEVQANFVVVSVANTADEPRTVTASVQVVLEGGAVETGAASVYVAPGTTATAPMPFSSQVDEVTTLGMSDDVQPF